MIILQNHVPQRVEVALSSSTQKQLLRAITRMAKNWSIQRLRSSCCPGLWCHLVAVFWWSPAMIRNINREWTVGHHFSIESGNLWWYPPFLSILGQNRWSMSTPWISTNCDFWKSIGNWKRGTGQVQKQVDSVPTFYAFCFRCQGKKAICYFVWIHLGWSRKTWLWIWARIHGMNTLTASICDSGPQYIEFKGTLNSLMVKEPYIRNYSQYIALVNQQCC